MANKRWRNRIAQIVLFVLLIAGIRIWQQRDMVSGAAPVLQGMTLAGQSYTLPVHPDHPVLVHFWATWCPICRTEQSAIADIAKDYPNTMTVAMQSGKSDAVENHMREQGVAFSVVNDPDGSIARAWGVHAVPVSFVISPDGNIRFVEVGYTTGIGLRLRLWLAGL